MKQREHTMMVVTSARGNVPVLALAMALGMGMMALSPAPADAQRLFDEGGRSDAARLAELREISELAADVLVAVENLNPRLSDTSGTLEIRGNFFQVTLAETVGSLEDRINENPGTTAYRAAINSREVVISIDSRSLDDFNENDRLTITVDGETIVDKPLEGLDDNDGLRLLAALGSLNSETFTRDITQRAEEQATGRIISSRIRTALRAAVGGARGRRDTDDDTQAQTSSNADGVSGLQVGLSPVGRGVGVGLSAGDGSLSGLAVWLNVSNNWVENDREFSELDGNITGVIAGGDYLVMPNVLVGVALNYGHTDIDTEFNDGKNETDSFGFTPFIGASFLDGRLLVDVSAGYSYVDGETLRLKSGPRVTGDFERDRWRANGNIAYGDFVTPDLLIEGVTGIASAGDHQDAFTESNGTELRSRDTYLIDWQTGVSGTYYIGDFELSTGATFVYDIRPVFVEDVETFDRTAVDVSWSATWLPREDLSLGLEVTNTFAREDVSDTGVVFYLRRQL